MSDTLADRIAKSKAYTAKLERQKRIEDKKKREAKNKKEQRRNYIIGELVAKYFPEVSNLEPRTKAENFIIFKPLETFLSILANNQELIKQLKEESICKISKEDKKEESSINKMSQRVSGHK